jgi:hypothetical protein
MTVKMIPDCELRIADWLAHEGRPIPQSAIRNPQSGN